MKRKFILLSICVLLALLVTIPANAITFGQYDGDAHPYVGMLVTVLPDGTFGHVCSGTKVPAAAGLEYDVFLTAAHCVAWFPEDAVRYVTFEHDQYPFDIGTNFIKAERAEFDPLFRGFGIHDLAVVLLPEDSTADIEPAEMAPLGLLDELNDKNGLKDQHFVAVGYGYSRQEKTGGPNAFIWEFIRQNATGSFNALTKTWLHISMNPSTGDGGSCYGDSGGPHLLGDSDMIVAVIAMGDAVCRSADMPSRIDTEEAYWFLSEFVDLP